MRGLLTGRVDILSWVGGVALAVGIYELGAHAAWGAPLRWLGEALAYGWPPAIVAGFILVTRYEERRVFNGTLCHKFRLGSEETLVFSWYLMHGAVWWQAQEFRLRVPLRVLAKAGRPFYGTPCLRVRLTDKRLAVGSLLGYTWRVIPLNQIRQLAKIPRRSIFKPAAVKIEYEFAGRTEALVVALNSTRGASFSQALVATTGLQAD